jgi:cytidylate kinase
VAAIIAIDGPAGSGKSSTAHAVAARLGLAHLDSGALYRAFTLAALDRGVPVDQGARIASLGSDLPVRLVLGAQGFFPEVAGVDVSQAVRRPDVTARVSAVSALREVRAAVNQALRDAARLHPRGVVMDGRDIGTVVFPEAPVKVYLTAVPEERARRRLLQENREVNDRAVRAEVARLLARDAADSGRAIAPLRRAPDAVDLDTTGLTVEQQVAAIVELARKILPELDIAPREV